MNDNRPQSSRGELLENQLRAHHKGGLSSWWQEKVKPGRERAGPAEMPGCGEAPPLWIADPKQISAPLENSVFKE